MKSRVILEIYRLIYGFDKWHSAAHLNSRSYRKTINEVCEKLKIRSILEIGCGLGFNLVGLNCDERIGIDIDHKVIRAARSINDKKINFYTTDDIYERSSIHPFALLCFNWIHELEERDLHELLRKYMMDADFILLDRINDNTPGYKYYHEYGFLDEKYKLVAAIAINDEPRSLLVYQIRD